MEHRVSIVIGLTRNQQGSKSFSEEILYVPSPRGINATVYNVNPFFFKLSIRAAELIVRPTIILVPEKKKHDFSTLRQAFSPGDGKKCPLLSQWAVGQFSRGI